MSHTRIVGLISLISAIVLGGWLTWVHFSFQNMTALERLELLWKEDTLRLESLKKFHKGWSSIKEVKVSAGDERAQKWADNIEVPIKTTPTGRYRLDILLISWVNNDNLGAIVQYDLFELPSENLKWEFGRTFTLLENYIEASTSPPE